MICLKSPESSEFAKKSGQKSISMLMLSLLTTIQLIFINREIQKIKSYALCHQLNVFIKRVLIHYNSQYVLHLPTGPF